MKVLVVVPRLDLAGGVANYYRVLRSHLDADKVYYEVGRQAGERGASAARLLGDFAAFHRRLRTGQFDLVHLNPSLGRRAVVRDGILLLIARAHRLPVLVFFRGWDRALAERITAQWAWLFRLVYGRASKLVVLAEEFRTQLAAWGIRTPVQVETTVVEDAACEAPRPASGSDRAPVNLLFMSRLDREKGLVEAIEAYARVRERHPNCRLTIAGDGPERSRAEQLVGERALPGVHFIGHVEGDAKRAAFLDADNFFPTCYGEGMPNAVLEAMAWGLPVVTRAVGGLRDFFEDGRMGRITDSRDPAELAALLLPLVGDRKRRDEIGAFNRAYARERFSASRVAARLEKIYAAI
ncbi:MAG: glycosyltransferase family 4 protein [Gammaproteobacteria bacterium]|nr:glycosyltransferase family 4 protein [Gammaproteobacteria bacterium]